MIETIRIASINRSRVGGIQADERHTKVTPENIAHMWNIGIDTTKRVLEVTMQGNIRTALHPLQRRYRADNLHLNHLWLRTTFYTDTLFSKVKSLKVYVEMPLGFRQEGKVLKLKCSLYGLRQSPFYFFKCLRDALISRGFKESNNDLCLFISKKVICVCYVDDCLFLAQQQDDINKVIASLQDNSKPDRLMLSVEDDVAGFLGILMQKKQDGSIELVQTGLIDRIL